MADEEIKEIDLKADEPAPEHEGEVREPERVEPDLKDMPDAEGKVEESGEDVVKKLMQERGIIEGEPKEEDTVEVPTAFYDAAKEQGWSDDDISEFAEGLDEKSLLEMIPTMFDEEEEDTEKEEPEKAPAKQQGEPVLPLKDDDKKSDPSPEVAALKKELEDLKSQLSNFSKFHQEREAVNEYTTVNKFFDEVGEQFEVFGKTDELLRYPAGPRKGQVVPTSPACKARSEVYDKADLFRKAGMPLSDALQEALTWYKGKNLEQDVHRKVVKDLKSHEKKLSARRSGKETVPEYEDEEERQAAVVREAARKAGVKWLE